MARLSGKIAIVTGGASRPGLGSATAERFAQEGAIVYLTDLDLAGAEAVAADIRNAGGQAHALKQDVTEQADWDRLFETVVAAHGRIDILVNNAGIAVLRTVEQTKADEWARQINVNLTSVYLGTQMAVAQMRKNGGGSIVNLSSIAGKVGLIGGGAYAASKGGVCLFTKCVALETAREGIRVNSVHPGMIMTNMQKVALRDNPEQYDIINAAIPMGYMGEPVDIANCILYLASDEARYVTGAEFVVDGGLIAQ